MPRVLLVSIRLHDGRFYGVGDWPPSPARLFQALIAGVGISGPLGESEMHALRWLERLKHPVIASPHMMTGQQFVNYMPDNDLDAKQGDQRRIGEILMSKHIKPRLFDAQVPFLYGWMFEANRSSQRQANIICTMTERLYQFGRGWDMAWAWAEDTTDCDLERRLLDYPGDVHWPSAAGSGGNLPCPTSGTLDSLMRRYAANLKQFQTGPERSTAFSQRPKAKFKQCAYGSPPVRQVYDLREHSPRAPFVAWPLNSTVSLVEALRDQAKHRLQDALPAMSKTIERILGGRKENTDCAGPTNLQVRLVPLPSTGHPDADRDIRRVLVEVPAGCPLPSADVIWAFTGQEINHPVYDKSLDVTPAEASDMLNHYGVDQGSHIWRSVTPVALPERATRRYAKSPRDVRLEKSGTERLQVHNLVASAVFSALWQAHVRSHPVTIRVQREPFEANGRRAETFASGTCFDKRRLWHVEICFSKPVSGPLVIGDGHSLGLGLMAPVRRLQGIYVFAIGGDLPNTVDANEMARALRRAVIARVQQTVGINIILPAFFTGHDSNGAIARSETQPHLTFIFDPVQMRFLIVAPHIVHHRQPTYKEQQHLETLSVAMAGFCNLKAGSAGRMLLIAVSIDTDLDLLFVRSRSWTSVTPYQVTRHKKGVGVSEALASDIRTECMRLGFPIPQVTLLEARGVSKVGLVAKVKLEFSIAVKGPVTLGRSRHLGGGLFEALLA